MNNSKPLNQSDIETWQKASQILDTLYKLSHQESIEQLNTLDITADIKQRVLQLLEAREAHDTLLNTPESIYLEQFNQTDLTGLQFGNFRLIELVGRGGMSAVYRARNVVADAQKDVAIKVMPPQILNEQSRQLFAQELRTLSKLHHPNIISLQYGSLNEAEIPYIQMELIENALPITEHITKKSLTQKQTLELLIQLCHAIEYAHLNGVIHRDIKPSNILIDEYGRLIVIDFGIAAVAEETDIPKAYTRTYAAPEQIQGQSVTKQTDVFSIAILLLECLKPSTDIKNWRKETADRSLLVPDNDMHYELKHVIEKALSYNPEKRYQKVSQLRSELQLWLHNKPLKSIQYSLVGKLAKVIQRQPIVSLLSLLLVSSFITGLSFSLWQMKKARTEQKKAIQVKDFLLNSIKQTDPDIALGKPISVKDMLMEANRLANTQSIEDKEQAAEIYLVIGSAMNRIGEYQNSIQPLMTANNLQPNNMEILNQLADAQIKVKQYDKAKITINQIKQLPLNNKQNISLKLLQGQMHTLKGEFEKAEKEFLNAIQQAKSIDDSILMTDAQIKLGKHYEVNHENQKSINLLREALNDAIIKLGLKNTQTLKIMATLAESLHSIDAQAIHESVKIYQQLIPAQKQLLGNQHPDVSKSLLMEAAAHKTLGNTEIAIQSAQQALAIAKVNFGDDHAFTGRVKMNLAQIHYSKGELIRASQLATESLESHVQHYGDTHYETLQHKTSVAALMLAAGDHAQALKLTKEIYLFQRKNLGKEHRATLYAQLVMAKALIGLQQSQESIRVAKECYSNSIKKDGGESILSIGCGIALEEALFLNGEYEEAAKIATEYINSQNPILNSKPEIKEKLKQHIAYINKLN